MRQILSAPGAAACLGVALVIGTAVGQAGHADDSVDFNPMGGMNMSGMDMPGMDMPGMDMPGMDMPGMDMPGMDMPGMDMPAGGGPTATATDTTPLAGMDMSDPNMAASMPGGLHTMCAATRCTVIFAKTATGTADVLGTTARLARMRAHAVTLTIGGKSVVLRPGSRTTVGRVRIKLTKIDAHQVTVVFVRH